MALNITHGFISPKAEQTDPTLVGPNEWNAQHTVTGFPYIIASDYNFTPQFVAGNLNPGSNTITLNPMPIGLIIGNNVCISGGTGAAESCPITGVNSNQIIITCANSHSGAWSVSSASFGINEAIGSLAGQPGVVDGTTIQGAKTLCGSILIPTKVKLLLGAVTFTGPTNAPSVILQGDFAELQGIGAGITNIQANLASGDIVRVANSNPVLIQHVSVSDLGIQLLGSAGSANGLSIYAPWYSRFTNLYVVGNGNTSGYGIYVTDHTFSGTPQGGYLNLFEHCFIGNDVSGRWARGVWLNAGPGGYNVTYTTFVNVNSSWNVINLYLGGGPGQGSATNTVALGGGFIYGSGDNVYVAWGDFLSYGSDIEGAGGYGVNGNNVENIHLYGTNMANNSLGNLNPTLSTTRYFNTNDLTSPNPGETQMFGSIPGVFFRNNNFIQGVRVGVSTYDGSSLALGYNIRQTSVSQGTLMDTTAPGGLILVNNVGLVFYTATAGPNPRALTLQFQVDASGRIKFGNAATGGGTATLGSNCPASITGAPYTWLSCLAPDGTPVWLPAWK